jgi:CHAD domain-containing protein
VSDERLRQPTAEAVTRLCLELVDRARDAERALGDLSARDALHDFRVAVRRLRSALRAWRPVLGKAVRRREQHALRELQRATGSGRDAEVALAWLEPRRASCAPEHAAGVEWLAQHWRAQLARAREGLDAELRGSFRDLAQRLERRLAHPPPARDEERFATALADAVRAAARDLFERLAGISEAGDEKRMHAARIACKRLRYLVEPFRAEFEPIAALLEPCKQLQDLLGELNDAFARGRALDEALAESAAARAARVGGLVRAGYADRARREGWFTEWPGLIELARVLADERAALFARLERDWLGRGAAELYERARVLADALRALSPAPACSG